MCHGREEKHGDADGARHGKRLPRRREEREPEAVSGGGFEKLSLERENESCTRSRDTAQRGTMSIKLRTAPIATPGARRAAASAHSHAPPDRRSPAPPPRLIERGDEDEEKVGLAADDSTTASASDSTSDERLCVRPGTIALKGESRRTSDGCSRGCNPLLHTAPSSSAADTARLDLFVFPPSFS